jgi:hypothetical protein
MLSCVLAITIGCSSHNSVKSYSEYRYLEPIKSYSTYWFATTDSNFTNPIDSISFVLSIVSNDSLGPPPWFSPSTSFDYTLNKRNLISLELISSDEKQTKPIVDSLDIGKYEFTFDGSRLKPGIYYWQKTIGEEKTIKKFLLIK